MTPVVPGLLASAAAKRSGRPDLAPLLTLIFGTATLTGMSAGVLAGLGGLSKVKFSAGGWNPALLLSGLAVKFDGL